MLFVSICQLESLSLPIDPSFGYELRLDLFPSIDLSWIRFFLQKKTHPVLLTLRKRSQGGNFQGTESQREEWIRRLLQLEPPFFDLEADMQPSFLQEVTRCYPRTKIILSHHHLQESSLDLDRIYQSMTIYPAFSYKIAVKVPSVNEALRLLLLKKGCPQMSLICLGEKGTFARVLGPVVGNQVDYASLSRGKETGAGQIPWQEFSEIYQYTQLNQKTEIYGLIGDPVDKSPGAVYHNAVFRKKQHNAVYVKMTVQPQELPVFIPLAKKLGVKGLSVTTPLKEAILPFIDGWEEGASQIGAINTLRLEGEKIWGCNTDGKGACDAIEKKLALQGKKVVLLGAGGAARGIAYEAKRRGAQVVFLNRTVLRAKKVALELGCEAQETNEIPLDTDLLIRCSLETLPIDFNRVHKEMVLMDIVYEPKETPFLKAALSKECPVIYGEEMFLNQAARQTDFWLNR